MISRHSRRRRVQLRCHGTETSRGRGLGGITGGGGRSAPAFLTALMTAVRFHRPATGIAAGEDDLMDFPVGGEVAQATANSSGVRSEEKRLSLSLLKTEAARAAQRSVTRNRARPG